MHEHPGQMAGQNYNGRTRMPGGGVYVAVGRIPAQAV